MDYPLISTWAPWETHVAVGIGYGSVRRGTTTVLIVVLVLLSILVTHTVLVVVVTRGGEAAFADIYVQARTYKGRGCKACENKGVLNTEMERESCKVNFNGLKA